MEELLHYVWKFRLFEEPLQTTDGQRVEIIDTGMVNTNAGPDFFNAKVKIGDTLWAGNVEIHTTSKDWYKHGHDRNPDYNSVVLHVTGMADKEIVNQKQQNVPQVELKCPAHIYDNYKFLLHADQYLPCCNFIGSVPAIHFNSWLETLLVERLEVKGERIQQWLERFQNSWTDVFYVTLCRNFGFGLNAEPFEQLALSLPLSCIMKHKDNLFQIEALLFGQAGLFDEDCEDAYFLKLRDEYRFLQKKYGLVSLNQTTIKKSRVRPQAFPQLRLAQLAALLHQTDHLFSSMLTCDDPGKLRLLFQINASEYWQIHYNFGFPSERKAKFLGDSSLDVILINTVVPLLFMYGRKTDNETLCERALSILGQVKPERNSIVREFAICGVPIRDAATTQALIELKKEYCSKRKCLFCRVGHLFMTTLG